MRNVVLALAASAVCLTNQGAAAAGPAFPTAWQSDYAQASVAWEGGTRNTTTGQVCCPHASPSCKVSAVGESLVYMVDASQPAALMTNGQVGILTLYAEKKQMQVVPSNTSKGWHCTSYCKVSKSDWTLQNPLYIGDGTHEDTKAKIGSATVNGKTYTTYDWDEGIPNPFKNGSIIPMEEHTFYVDMSTASHGLPFQEINRLIPLNKSEIAEDLIIFENFKEGAPASHYFQVDNLDTCTKDSKSDCDDDDSAQFSSPIKKTFRAFERLNKRRENLWEAAHRQASQIPETVMKTEKPTVSDKPLSWPGGDWFATQTVVQLLNQGGHANADNSATCCDRSFGGQCQIQYAFQDFTSYHDASHNRSRTETPVGATTVNDYTRLMSMTVVFNGTNEVCQYYCPIDPRDTISTGRDEWIDDNATYLGKVDLDGKPAAEWTWTDTIFKVIKMETSDFYGSVSASGHVTPIMRVDHLTPWGGPEIGQGNTTIHSFKEGAQPASKFNILDVDSCPIDPNGCGGPGWQRYRLHQKQLHTFARYHTTLV